MAHGAEYFAKKLQAKGDNVPRTLKLTRRVFAEIEARGVALP